MGTNKRRSALRRRRRRKDENRKEIRRRHNDLLDCRLHQLLRKVMRLPSRWKNLGGQKKSDIQLAELFVARRRITWHKDVELVVKVSVHSDRDMMPTKTWDDRINKVLSPLSVSHSRALDYDAEEHGKWLAYSLTVPLREYEVAAFRKIMSIQHITTLYPGIPNDKLLDFLNSISYPEGRTI